MLYACPREQWPDIACLVALKGRHTSKSKSKSQPKYKTCISALVHVLVVVVLFLLLLLLLFWLKLVIHMRFDRPGAYPM